MKTRILPVRLTDDEVRQRGEQIAAKHYEIDAIDVDFQTKKDAYKALRSAVEGDMKQLVREVRNRAEDREVEVAEQKDFERFVVETVRVDTGEVIETRGMNASERQEPLPFDLRKRAES